MIDKILRAMLSENQRDATFPKVHFAQACRFALDHGGRFYDREGDTIFATVPLNGRTIDVLFLKETDDGGTFISIKD